MAVNQLAVFIENQQGSLGAVARLLSDGGVNLQALSIADTQNYGILRMIVNDNDLALKVLKENGMIATVTAVVAVEIPHSIGGLADVLGILSDAGVNVEYIYAFIGTSGKNANVVLRVGDNAKAEAALVAGGVRLLTEADLA